MLKFLTNLILKKPVLAVFEVNLQCNSKCGYCNLPLNEGRYEMTREEIKSVFSGLYDYGIRYVFIQGGEPTIRKDILEIIGDLDNIGFDLTLITNGTRLTEEFIARLAKFPVNLSISLDTLSRENYHAIRGADQLSLVLAGIERLQHYPHPKYITCIVSEKNLDDVHSLIRFTRDNGFVPVLGAYHWDVQRYGKIDRELQYRKEAAAGVFNDILKSDLIPRGYFRNYIRDNINWLNGKKLRQCDAGKYSVAIDPSGNVAPCLALKHAGNLLDSSLEEILVNFNRDEINHCSDQSSCNMMCSRVVGSNLANPYAAMITPDHIRLN